MLDEQDDLTEAKTEDEFYSRVERRCAYFEQAFQAYNEKLDATGLSGASLNRVLMANCVESYFLDIHRLKTFHRMERADKYKIAGYSLKWLSKIRPIQTGALTGLPKQAQKRGIIINADFAVIMAMMISKVNFKAIDLKMRHGLLYSAHYRDLDGGIMALKMELLARTYPY